MRIFSLTIVCNFFIVYCSSGKQRSQQYFDDQFLESTWAINITVQQRRRATFLFALHECTYPYRMQGYVDTAPTRLEDNLGQILDHAFRTLNGGSNSVIFIIKKNEAAFQDRPDRICAVLFTDGRSINSIGELKLTSSSSCHVNVIVGTWGPLSAHQTQCCCMVVLSYP